MTLPDTVPGLPPIPGGDSLAHGYTEVQSPEGDYERAQALATQLSEALTGLPQSQRDDILRALYDVSGEADTPEKVDPQAQLSSLSLDIIGRPLQPLYRIPQYDLTEAQKYIEDNVPKGVEALKLFLGHPELVPASLIDDYGADIEGFRASVRRLLTSSVSVRLLRGDEVNIVRTLELMTNPLVTGNLREAGWIESATGEVLYNVGNWMSVVGEYDDAKDSANEALDKLLGRADVASRAGEPSCTLDEINRYLTMLNIKSGDYYLPAYIGSVVSSGENTEGIERKVTDKTLEQLTSIEEGLREISQDLEIAGLIKSARNSAKASGWSLVPKRTKGVALSEELKYLPSTPGVEFSTIQPYLDNEGLQERLQRILDSTASLSDGDIRALDPLRISLTSSLSTLQEVKQRWESKDTIEVEVGLPFPNEKKKYQDIVSIEISKAVLGLSEFEQLRAIPDVQKYVTTKIKSTSRDIVQALDNVPEAWRKIFLDASQSWDQSEKGSIKEFVRWCILGMFTEDWNGIAELYEVDRRGYNISSKEFSRLFIALGYLTGRMVVTANTQQVPPNFAETVRQGLGYTSPNRSHIDQLPVIARNFYQHFSDNNPGMLTAIQGKAGTSKTIA